MEDGLRGFFTALFYPAGAPAGVNPTPPPTQNGKDFQHLIPHAIPTKNCQRQIIPRRLTPDWGLSISTGGIMMLVRKTSENMELHLRLRRAWLPLFLLLSGQIMNSQTGSGSDAETFAQVVKKVTAVSPLIVLSDSHNRAVVAISTAMQGRVLTSSADGMNGRSLGWVNTELIASKQIQQHINSYGGEDRLWIAPEGGQFSVFFAPNTPFDLEHWYTPAAIDTEPFTEVSKSKTSASFRKQFSVENHSGTKFKLELDREVKLLSDQQVWTDLKIPAAKGVRVVAFESTNKMTNAGAERWSKSKGLLAIWVLGQFQAAPSTTIVIPIEEGTTAQLGIPVTSDYFGTIPANRLAVKSNAVFMKADADYRGKLGINPKRAKGVLGSYDADHHLLTIVQQTAVDPNADYVNGAWKIQDEPYKGDVTNAYNDGPQANGERLGRFYEMESLSPAVELEPGKSVEHTHRTIHIEGDDGVLNEIARAVLGVTLQEIKSALPGNEDSAK